MKAKNGEHGSTMNGGGDTGTGRKNKKKNKQLDKEATLEKTVKSKKSGMLNTGAGLW